MSNDQNSISGTIKGFSAGDAPENAAENAIIEAWEVSLPKVQGDGGPTGTFTATNGTFTSPVTGDTTWEGTFYGPALLLPSRPALQARSSSMVPIPAR